MDGWVQPDAGPRPALIDTHCHLDAAAFQADLRQVIERARAVGVRAMVVPAVAVSHFAAVQQVARDYPGVGYALGIHPLFVDRAAPDDLAVLEAALHAARQDPRLVAVGEIGLDFFVPGLDRTRMTHFWRAQLQMACALQLPVIVHSRRAVDPILAALRRCPPVGGLAHAFQGSMQQAQAMIGLKMALGLGGVMTFPRALRIRRLAVELSLDHCVLETDAPDMPPAWCAPARNEPAHVAQIAQVWADLRGVSVLQVAQASTATALRVLPRLAALLA